MRVLLVAFNAKYIHSNLAVYTLRAYARKCSGVYAPGELRIDIAEYTINQQPDDILRSIYKKSPDLLCFSCYIWNMSYVEGIVKEIDKLLPDTDIWLGGPEVSYDAGEVLERLPSVKGVMRGEGERTFADLCRIYMARNLEELAGMAGITYRQPDGRIQTNIPQKPLELDDVPFVYEDTQNTGNMADMGNFEHKILYYEASRGCPFSCSYCLSSIDRRVRFRSLPLVKRELQFFLNQKVPQVKFVDRTFNLKHERTLEIWRYLIEQDNGITNFHFEIAADLLNEEELALIRTMRPGLIQLEIGVQSTNLDTLKEIRRAAVFERIKKNVTYIRSGGNVHCHLDLIAGLPFEDRKSFARSFDEVYALRPDQLQLGFLKVLKGSYMEENRKAYGLVFKESPPYEVLSTKWLSYDDVLKLKGVEEMVEVYYNSGQFSHTLDALSEEFSSPWQLYMKLWKYYERGDYLDVQHKRSARYEILLEFIKKRVPEKAEKFRELLVYDYYLRENAKTRPGFAGEYTVEKEFLREFYEIESREHRYLPEYKEYDKNQMRKMTHIENFTILQKMLLFDYKCRNPLNQEARTCMIKKDLYIRKGR